MRKIVITCLICVSILLISCQKKSAQSVLEKYLDAERRSNYSEAYEYLSMSDQETLSEEEFMQKYKPEESVLRNMMLEKMSYSISGMEVQNETASAEVTKKLPDLETMMADLFQDALLSVFSGTPSDTMMEELVKEKYKDGNFPMIEIVEEYNLKREQGQWKIFLDLKIQVALEKLQEEVVKLKREKKFAEAIIKLEEIGKIASEYIENVTSEIKMLESQIEKQEQEAILQKEKEKYFPKLLIKNVKVADTYLGVGVFGEVKNTGNRTLDRVKIIIYGLDKNGKAIFERDYHPVLVVKDSFSLNPDKPLKPNYSEEFGCRMDGAPSDWNRKVRIEVTDIEFHEKVK